VFVALQLPEHRRTLKVRKERLRENHFAIETLRTLSEEPSIINCCSWESRLIIALADRFFFTRLPVCHSERSEESQALAISALAKAITRDVSRRST
jgi:hypothetical protein